MSLMSTLHSKQKTGSILINMSAANPMQCRKWQTLFPELIEECCARQCQMPSLGREAQEWTRCQYQ